MRSVSNNDDAVSVTVEYVLLSSIFIFFFFMVFLCADDLLIKNPKTMVIEEQFRDIGNMMSNTITDMYLIAPENGIIDTQYIIPPEVGKETYIISAESTFIDQVIGISSSESDICVNVTISGIANTIPINGTAFSHSQTHRISYSSDR